MGPIVGVKLNPSITQAEARVVDHRVFPLERDKVGIEKVYLSTRESIPTLVNRLFFHCFKHARTCSPGLALHQIDERYFFNLVLEDGLSKGLIH